RLSGIWPHPWALSRFRTWQLGGTRLQYAGLPPQAVTFRCRCLSTKDFLTNANDQPTRQPGPKQGPLQDQIAGAAIEPAKTRRLHARLHLDAEETEFGAA